MPKKIEETEDPKPVNPPIEESNNSDPKKVIENSDLVELKEKLKKTNERQDGIETLIKSLIPPAPPEPLDDEPKRGNGFFRDALREIDEAYGFSD